MPAMIEAKQKSQPKRKPISLYLSRDHARAIREIAHRERRSLTGQIEKVVTDFIEASKARSSAPS